MAVKVKRSKKAEVKKVTSKRESKEKVITLGDLPKAVRDKISKAKLSNYDLKNLNNGSKRSLTILAVLRLTITKESKTYSIKDLIGKEYIATSLPAKVRKDYKSITSKEIFLRGNKEFIKAKDGSRTTKIEVKLA